MPTHEATPPLPTGDVGRRFHFNPQERMRVPVSARYTRFVGAMKLLLPVLALVLIGTVIIWSGSYDRDQGIQLSFLSSSSDKADRLTMVNPRYVGADGGNRPFVVTADLAEQDPANPKRVTLTGVQADMTADDGAWFTAMSPAGHYHQDTHRLTLDGPINVYSDAGYEFHADAVEINLAQGTALSDRPVSGQGPFGTLRADAMRVSERGRRFEFNGNVRLVIEPGRQGRT